MAGNKKSTQGYGFAITGGSLSVALIDAQIPGYKIGLRESTTLANEAYVTRMVNKLAEAESVDLVVDIADSSTVFAAKGINAQYTLTIAGVFTFVGWGVITGLKSSNSPARTHDHDIQETFTLEWTNQNTTGAEVAPTWSIT